MEEIIIENKKREYVADIIKSICEKYRFNKVNNDGLIFLVIMTSFYVINLYICNDFFIRLIS